MEGIKLSKRPRLKKPFLIVAWPGMGEVAFKAANYLIEELRAEEFASIPPEEFFYLTGSTVNQGVLSTPDLPYSKFYYYKNKSGKNDFIFLISNAQPDLARADAYSRRVIQLAKSFKVDTVVSFASMPLGIDHTQEPGVWFAATSTDLAGKLRGAGLNALSEGATVITFFQEKGIPSCATGFGVSACAHIADEYVKINNLYKGTLALEHFLRIYQP